jgi:CRP/FNR family cyclic AMP-dependent transcriptional regulator
MEFLELFRDAPDAVALPAGEPIFRAGDAGDRMFVVLEGEVYLVVDDRVVEVAGPGAVIGEMGLIERKPRTGDAFTKSDCKIVPIDGARFEGLVRQTPAFALHVMRVLSERLRRTTQRLDH